MLRKLNHALTPLAVKNAKAGPHADGGGLNLLVKDSGARSWVFRYMIDGKSHDMGLALRLDRIKYLSPKPAIRQQQHSG